MCGIIRDSIDLQRHKQVPNMWMYIDDEFFDFNDDKQDIFAFNQYLRDEEFDSDSSLQNTQSLIIDNMSVFQ